MTDEELNALVFALDHDHPDDIDYRACSTAITTLRAQLAEARAVNEEMQAAVAIAEDYTHRAEAALAAQIEVDAGIACRKCGASRAAWLKCSHIICLGGDAFGNQPHDRTALERHDAKTREKALREAVDTVTGWHPIAAGAILALIEKPE